MANDDEGDQGGTPEDVFRLEQRQAMRTVVWRLAMALLTLAQLVDDDDIEVWNDNVKVATDLLLRFGGKASGVASDGR